MSNETLRFEPFANIMINRHESDEVDADYCRETAALVFVEAAKVTDRLHELMTEALDRHNQQCDRLRRQRDGLDGELTQAQQRIRDLETPGRPDPLGLALPRTCGEPPVVSVHTASDVKIDYSQLDPAWCAGWNEPVVMGSRRHNKGTCAICGRRIGLQKNGNPRRHKRGRGFND